MSARIGLFCRAGLSRRVRICLGRRWAAASLPLADCALARWVSSAAAAVSGGADEVADRFHRLVEEGIEVFCCLGADPFGDGGVEAGERGADH
jgi:hypothetical protein